MEYRHRSPVSMPKAQRGVSLVLIVGGLAAMIMMTALALDVGHATLNKTRLQNATDAAALAAAKAIDETANADLATLEARQAFAGNASSAGNRELAEAYASGNGDIQLVVQYSQTLPPFTPGAPAGPYVRVIVTGFRAPTWLARLGGIAEMTVAASAVAGPSPVVNNACNIAPMMVCGDPGAGAGNLWGYTVDAPTVLKKSAPGGDSPVGPGNFQLIRLGGSGANIVRENMAGAYNGCATTGETLETQTGNEAGPVAQGLNTRFGQYNGPMSGTQDQYPPDVIVRAQSPELTVVSDGTNNTIMQGSTTITAENMDTLYDYHDYKADLANPASYDYQPREDGGTGAYDRRIVAVPVGNCTGTVNGQGSVAVLGFACFFLLQPVVQRGNDAYVLGQFIGECDVNGTPGPNPGAGPSPYIIQLYRDPDSGDS